jgi:NAD(P)-dependent dehydrogenase (short-subunit alcohol dehydrogenase family)
MVQTNFPLRGQVILVTGAGRGFGEAIARRLARQGAAVALLARRAEDVQRVAAAIQAEGGSAHAVAGDATVAADVERSITETEAAFGPITGFVNNAGVGWPYGPVSGIDTTQWWEAQKLHQLAPMLFLSRLLPGMVERRHGRIVIISSRAHTMVIPNFSPYAIGKLVQARLAQVIDAENRADGISAFAIDPGFVFTDMAREGLNNADAQRHIGFFVDMLKQQESEDQAQVGLDECGERVAQLFSGKYDALSGTYLAPEVDLDESLKQCAEKVGL